MQISFNSFVDTTTRAQYSNIPIKYLPVFREISKTTGKYYKLRYRGPRNTPADAGRPAEYRASTCLKQNAVAFSAYNYE
jgi:hypothetical protein